MIARSRAGPGLAAASVVVILAVTLWPVPPAAEVPRTSWLAWDELALTDFVRNALLFLPLGIALAVRGISALRALLRGALLSLAIEIAQNWIPGRDASALDVLANASGTFLGAAAFHTQARWLAPSDVASARLALAAAVAFGAVVAGTGWLAASSHPRSTYYAGWVPELGYFEVYDGKVERAFVGDVALPQGPQFDSVEVRGRLSEGAPIHVAGVAGTRASSLAPLLTLHDEAQREILVLGVERDDLVLRRRTRATEIGFYSPELVVQDGARGLAAGAPIDLTVSRDGPATCFELNAVSHCGVGLGPGRGWAFLVDPRSPLQAHTRMLDFAWIAALALPIGFWLRARPPAIVAVAVVVAGLALLPPATGLLPARPAEWLAVACGVSAGALVRRELRSRTARR